METEITFVFHESPGGGYQARALGHSIFTRAETMEELEANVKEAVACRFAEGEPLPGIRLVKAQPTTRIIGSAKGEFTVPDDFNDSNPEIEGLFYNGPLFPE
jgi:hypothetical protein